MPNETEVRTHQWVKMVITPVEVLDNGDGHPVVMVDPDKEANAQNKASYGCMACNEPLEGNLNTPCTLTEERQ